ncbi:MAG: restriction endonuclease subunit S [Gammaproteobacteria bacterium]
MWKTVKLGEILKTGAGGTPLKSQKSYYEGGTIKWLLSGAVCERDIHDSKTHITEDGLANSSAKLFPINTVLVAMYGATAGQVGILRTEAATNQAVCGIYPSKDYLPEFLYYYLTNYKETLLLEVSGVAQPNLSQVKIKNIPLPLISLAEQQRIVAKLDAAFAEIDRAVEFATSCLENTKAIINSTLNEFFIAEGKQWSVVPLADTCIIERGSSPRPIKQFLTEDEGVNWIKIGDTDKDGKYVRGTKEKITFEGAKKSRSVRKGDFILTNSMSYGRPYIMDIDGCIHDGWFALRLNENIDAEYYYYLLASPYVQNQFHTLAAGAVVKNISSDLVKRAVLPMPPLARQIEIRNRILAIEAQTEKAANCHRGKIQMLSYLKSAILLQELQPPQSEAA